MKNIFLLFSISMCLFFFCNNAFAQMKIEKDFTQKMEVMNMTFVQPLEQSYKRIKTKSNIILDADFTMKAKKADMEIRFALFPEGEKSFSFPHISVMSKAASVATNEDEDAPMVLHEMSKKDLATYEADWGATVFFQPKELFTDKKHCKMLALYREGKGLAYVFYLFNEASEEVDFQKYCLGFLEGMEE